jgi:hypothetical protein
MGKKSRRKEGTSSMAAGFRNIVENHRREMVAQSFAAMAELDRFSLEGQKSTIRAALKDMGTDLAVNDADPTGNGDQSLIQSCERRDGARELYSIGGDIHKHATEGAFSELGTMCFIGGVKAAHIMIENVTKKIQQPYSRQKEMITLLEMRDTSLRLSPLLLIVSAGKNASGQPYMDHAGVAKILLKSGASPDAKDVLGKTVCHYGAGAMATSMTMEVVDMCIRAARSSHLFGKDVELHGLKNVDMNGLKGVAGGFDPDSERRAVYLPDQQKEVWVKPINIRLAESNGDAEVEEKPMLADVQDRLGSVALHEVILQGREDVAEFLLIKHQASIHTADMDDMTPLKMSIGGSGMMMASKVRNMVMDVTRQEAKNNREAKKQATRRSCAACQKELGKMGGHQCSSCKVTVYCGRECQVAHWKKGHKAQCKKLKLQSAGVKLEAPSGDLAFGAAVSVMSGMTNRGKYSIPDGASPEEKFVIKVQGINDMMPIMVYDESRTCKFSIGPKQPGFNEILTEMRKEMAWGGRKTFMKASFDDSGTCTVYPATAGVKAKYSW